MNDNLMTAQRTPTAGMNDLGTVFAPVRDELTQVSELYGRLIRERILDFVPQRPGRDGSAEFFPVFNFMRRFAEDVACGKGKWIRAGVTLLAADYAGGKASHAIATATAIELIHTATLLHDDVIDQSPLRRGQPSIPNQWDNSLAVLGGDLLLSLAFHLLTQDETSGCQRVVAEAALNVCLGEMAQEQSSRTHSLTEEEYLAVIDRKTASLFKACAKCGALIGKGGDTMMQALVTFGHAFGMTFQIVDDLMDLLQSESDMGKPSGSDYTNGRVTLALIHHQRELGLSSLDLTGRSLDELKDALYGTGSFEYAYQTACDFADEARNAIAGHPSRNEAAKASLEALTKFILERKS